MSQELAGRVALVTGALRGIGRACAEQLAQEGAHVILSDLPTPEGDEVRDALGAIDGASYLRLDAAGEEGWREAAAVIGARHGRLDVLVNNAGIDLVGRTQDIPLEKWRRLMSINLDGVFLGVKHMADLLEAGGRQTRGGASVINVSSIMGLVAMAETAAYCSSKGAVRLFSKAVALEFCQARRPIRVNSLHPGFVETPLLRQGMERWVAEGKAETAQQLIDGLGAHTPIGRVAQPGEIAAVVVFLAGDGASYMTGSEIVVDGGWTAH